MSREFGIGHQTHIGGENITMGTTSSISIGPASTTAFLQPNTPKLFLNDNVVSILNNTTRASGTVLASEMSSGVVELTAGAIFTLDTTTNIMAEVFDNTSAPLGASVRPCFKVMFYNSATDYATVNLGTGQSVVNSSGPFTINAGTSQVWDLVCTSGSTIDIHIASDTSSSSSLKTALYIPSWAQYWSAGGGGRPAIPLIDNMEYSNQNCFFSPESRPDMIYYAFMGFNVDTGTDAVTITELTPSGPGDIGDYDQVSGIVSQNESSEKYISLGGFVFGNTQWLDAIGNGTRITNFATAVDDLLTATDCQGIDLDWENSFPTQGGDPLGELTGLNNLILALKAANPNMTISIPIVSNPTIINNILGGTVSGPISTSIKNNIDHVIMMTYDIHGPWEVTTGPNAGIVEVTAIVDTFIATGISPSKLLMGIPFYARTWTTTTDATSPHPVAPYGISGPLAGPPILVSIEAGLMNYAELVALLYWRSNTTYLTKAVADYDATTESAYMWITPSTAIVQTSHVLPSPIKWVMASFDDVFTVEKKMALAKSKNLGGVVAWHIAGDTFYRGAPLWSAITRNK